MNHRISLVIQYKDPQGNTHIIESDEVETFGEVPEITRQLKRMFNSKTKEENL